MSDSAADAVPPAVPPVEPAGGWEIDEVTGFRKDPSGSGSLLHPETGEVLSKNGLKKLLKPKKEKKERVLPNPPGNKKDKVKKEKVAEAVVVDQTPKGDKKILEGVFPTGYQPEYVESAWQDWWEKSGFYAPNVEEALAKGQEDKFVMVIPPPNVTGSLHLGHALTTAVEDTLTRWHRMKGKITLWVPGTDHAGIATQSVVEKRLKKEEDVTRHDLGREKFIERVWEWKEQFGSKITGQIRSLGASVDWNREVFTMDEKLGRAVTEAFVKFHEDGILYRDTRLINWSCALRSAISEIEVDKIDIEPFSMYAVPNHTKQDKYEFGVISSFSYKVDGLDEEVVVATTRLETMLGDTAVAVHPEDPRYTHLHGKFVKHPFVDRLMPIILDPELVDMTFGTGAVKITPAHDPNDYKCGKRHDLEFITVLDLDGTMSANCAQFSGMMRYDARISVREELEKIGQWHGKGKNKMALGFCQRSGDIIEPMLTPQWYVNCSGMAERALNAVKSGELEIKPEMHKKTWYHWLGNIQDWCISRQLWWGHRIPAYFARIKGETPRRQNNDQTCNDRWIVARTRETAVEMAAARLNIPASEVELEQDEDVLDTWFSSGLFPFSVFGWPDRTDDLKAFYPTQLLETGMDILFFWVARMVMMGLHLTDTLPFKTVYLHAMVRDKNGRKMSKSLGNVIDPLEVIHGCTLETLTGKVTAGNLPAKEVKASIKSLQEDFPTGIPQCGSDALRFGLLAYTVQGNDVNLDIKRVVGYRQFCNKIWNAIKFALTYVSDFEPSPAMVKEVIAAGSPAGTRDRAILSSLNRLVGDVNTKMAAYVFGDVVQDLYAWFMDQFCDVYLELVKPVVFDETDANAPARRCVKITLYHCLETYLRLIHPMMPFVSEELWQRLPNKMALTQVPSIMIAPYPESDDTLPNADAEADLALVIDAVRSARHTKVECNIPPRATPTFYYIATGAAAKSMLGLEKDFCTLVKPGSFGPAPATPPASCTVTIVNQDLQLLMDMAGSIDKVKEGARLTKEIMRLEPELDKYERKIKEAEYVSKVPLKVQELNTAKISSLKAELETVRAALLKLDAM